MKTALTNNKRKSIIFCVITILCIVGIIAIDNVKQNTLNAPENVITSEIGMHTVKISWDKVKNATSYEVKVFEKDGEQILLTEMTDVTEIEVDGLLANHNYDVTVVAYKENNQKRLESESSEKINVQTLAPEPAVVASIQATGNSTESIVIQWVPYETADVNADGTAVEILYTLLCSAEENGEYTILAENIKEAEYLHEGLKELDVYYYKVIVQEKMDDLIYNSKENDMPAFARTNIGMVSNLVAEGSSSSEIEISWDAYSVEKTNIDKTPVSVFYTIYVADAEDGEFTVLADKVTETSFKEKELSPETTRYYKVSVMVQIDGQDVTGEQSSVVKAVTQKKKVATASGSGDPAKDAAARAVAQQIANSITGSSDLEKVRKAAAIVAQYCMNAVYTSSDPDYRTPYGLFCKGVYTCAGSTRALGLVLECMGYSWTHANVNQWTHQWCELIIDGQPGWADGMGGIADYGPCPFATGQSYVDGNGNIYFAP